ncbi:putative calcium-activated potassium channel (Kef-type K+ transport protein) [Desulfamplus magnetovallimortis]|uniref:Putative calcium-activated potassium channel (Kef-type K+ transport protein) n=1 Tax=Desulfamplus magnetovallimortis TaxID=1246637 RepID=A0A1W1HL63_9BACT|nr:potassium channel family protein [Desulfamplus magnetovallimortis]SLM33219.1 putative calcium-activated potassium channel (Kef-type K+ transport protein) [Desulfamplus magnetovallimortis]
MISSNKNTNFIRQLIHLLKREKIHKVMLAAIAVLLFGSTLIMYFEQKIRFSDALWWSIVTMTTVGYGDISPATTGGRVVALFVMLSGIGLIGLLTATIATIFIENKLLEKRGVKETDISNHFLICGWNFKGNTIISEMRADPKSRYSPIVIVAELAQRPDSENDDNVMFVNGQIDAATLKRCHADKAIAAIILSDESLDSYSRDAKTILNTMSIKNFNPEIYTCVELMSAKNMEHCKIAGADEIIVAGEISTNLLVQGALNHGITRLVSEIVSNRYGHDLYKIKLPTYLAGKNFFQVMCLLKEKENLICIGIEDGSGKNMTANPDNDYIVKEDDWLLVISWERPDIS